jgi:hypothetical protein
MKTQTPPSTNKFAQSQTHILAVPLTLTQAKHSAIQALNMKMAYLSFATLESLGLNVSPGNDLVDSRPDNHSRTTDTHNSSFYLQAPHYLERADNGNLNGSFCVPPDKNHVKISSPRASHTLMQTSEEWSQAGKQLLRALAQDSPQLIIVQLIEFVRLCTPALEAYMRIRKVCQRDRLCFPNFASALLSV